MALPYISVPNPWTGIPYVGTMIDGIQEALEDLGVGGGGGGGSAWRSGPGVPSNGLGVNGDFYLNETNGDVYEKTGGVYVLTANIKGPPGADGIIGMDGTVWRTGSGTPSNGLGVDGDYYLDSVTGDVYERVLGAYTLVANIKGPTGATGATGSTTGRLLFFQDTADVAVPAYVTLSTTPTQVAEDDDQVTITNASGEVLLDSYITSDDLNTGNQIPPGLWEFSFYRYVSNAAQISQLRFRVYTRTVGGTETEIFSIYSGDINDTTVTLQSDLGYVTTVGTPVATTDRIVVKVYAVTDSNSNKTIHFVHSGGTHVSHIHTPLAPPRGTKWFTGSGVPSNSLGLEGDNYLDTSNGDVYNKSGGVWVLVANIVPKTNLSVLWQGDAVPASLGPAGGVWRIPYENGVSKTYDLQRLVLRVENVAITGSPATTIQLQKSPGGGAFTPTTVSTMTLAAGVAEHVITTSLGTVTSGELVRLNWTSVGIGPSIWTVTLEGKGQQ